MVMVVAFTIIKGIINGIPMPNANEIGVAF
jgi:hypothetical protein